MLQGSGAETPATTLSNIDMHTPDNISIAFVIDKQTGSLHDIYILTSLVFMVRLDPKIAIVRQLEIGESIDEQDTSFRWKLVRELV